MKRLLPLLLVLLMLFCGCDTDSTADPTVTTAPPVETLYRIWNGVTYKIGSDMNEEFQNDRYIYYVGDGFSLKIIRGYVDEGITSADDYITNVSLESMKKGYSCESKRTNNVPYIIAKKGDEHQLYAYYIQNDDVWQVWCVVHADQVADLGAITDRLVTYMTSLIITENSTASGSGTTPPSVENTPVATPTYVTVHAYVPSDWGTPRLWAWSSSTQEELYDSWPGQTMSRSGDYYTAQIPTWVDSILINGQEGNVQTIDHTIETGREVWVVVHGTSSSVSYSQPTIVNPGTATGETITMYAYLPDSWSTPRCWAWSSVTEENAFAAWPGEAMILGDGLYYIELPAWIDSFLINANDATVQTADLSVEPGRDFWVSIADDGTVIRLNIL